MRYVFVLALVLFFLRVTVDKLVAAVVTRHPNNEIVPGENCIWTFDFDFFLTFRFEPFAAMIYVFEESIQSNLCDSLVPEKKSGNERS